MRILHSIHSLNPAGGGPIEFIRQLLPLYAADGMDVTVVSLDDPAEKFVKDFPGNSFALGHWTRNYGFSPAYHKWLTDNVRNFDVVVINGMWQFHGADTRAILKKTNVPYVIFPHGMLDPWFKQAYPWKHFKKQIYWGLIEHKVVEDAAMVLFTSEQERMDARATFHPYKCREHVLGYGTAPAPGDAAVQKQLFESKFPQLREKKFLLFMSRLHPKKGCDLLLKAFDSALTELADTYLLVAGPEYKRGYANELLSLVSGNRERVVFSPMLEGDLKWGALRNCSAMILPSHQENFGVVVAEALACARPVLISRKVNIAPTILKCDVGLVEPDTLEGTAALLSRWSALSAEQKSKMSDNAIQCFEEHFNITEIYKRLNLVLRNIVSQSSRSDVE